MILAGFIADQRTTFGVPQAVACRALGVSESWFYKWRNRRPSARDLRRSSLDAAVKGFFDVSGGTYGSPRILVDLREAEWTISKKTVEASMRRQDLVARPKKRRRGLTKADKGKRPAPDLLGRDFTADRPNQKWCGDFKQIDTDEGPIFLGSCLDLFARRMLGFALSDHHPTTDLATAAINMAVAVRGGDVTGVIFHADRGSQYTSDVFADACHKLGITLSMGRVGSALDNAVAESFFSTLEHELLSRRRFATRAEARRAVATWIDQFYNPRRRHSTNGMISPIDYENATTAAKKNTATVAEEAA
jgi:transposase InsO family protein